MTRAALVWSRAQDSRSGAARSNPGSAWSAIRVKLKALSRARDTGAPLETALYLPVKRFLENLGFTVKGEVGGCDLVALSGGEPPIVVIGELKLSFNLELVLQAVDRAGACDEVWLAARMSVRGKGRESDARYRNLCRRLGFGMLAVTSTGDVEVIVKPPTTSPRRNPKKRSRLSRSIDAVRGTRRWAEAHARRS
jgi:hypothetical protein